MDHVAGNNNLSGPDADWERRLARVVEMMRDISRYTDPQQMVLAYSKHVERILSMDRMVATSRRGLDRPQYRITRSTTWGLDRNPWNEQDRLPVFEGGLLGELLYGDEPRLIDDLEVSDQDPAAQFLMGMRSVMAIPVYDQGIALNMVLMMRESAGAFDRDQFADQVWVTNLFGRATKTLVLSIELKKAYEIVDHEMKRIGSLQRSLLPKQLPDIPTMSLAEHYQPVTRSGGDYYDFFPMNDGSWGIMIADVSGHGSSAAVLMAITHVLAHTIAHESMAPARLLEYVNGHLAQRYTSDTGRFVTAFYGIYHPVKRELTYACAGHNPPRLKRCQDGSLFSLDGVGNPPLGIIADQKYDQITQQLQPGDQIIFYTDGIVEAFNPDREMFGLGRLDEALGNCEIDVAGLIESVLAELDRFTRGRPADDDRTILVAKVR